MIGARYLLYNIDKHQGTPWYADDLSPNWIADAEDSNTAIVDLHNGMVYCGQSGWKKIAVVRVVDAKSAQ